MVQASRIPKPVSSSVYPPKGDLNLINIIIDSIQDIKGKNIVRLDLSKLDESPANCFIICEGDSTTQIKAISDNIYKNVKEELKIIPNHTEGIRASRWILVDYFSIVVHIFYPEVRSFYNLETLWNDAERTVYD